MLFDSKDVVVNRAPVAHKRHIQTKRAACANGLYISPTANAQVDSSKPMVISWDSTCFSPAPTAVDIYMTAPYNANPQIYTWYAVNYAAGTLSVDLKPKWWNSTSSISMQLNIVESGMPSFLTTFPVGPIFVASYDAASAATNSAAAAAANTAIPDSPYTTVNNTYHASGLSKGQLGAAVLLPLLIVFTAIGIYVRISRKKEKTKRQRWSQAVDKRMSTISTDWKSMSGAAANHAIRQSMAFSGDRDSRASSFFAGTGPRPSSTFTSGTEPGQAGVGARYAGLGLGGNVTDPDMSQIRRPLGTANSPAARVSRVSFAADVHPRPSMGDSLRTSVYTTGTGPSRTSRAFHRGTVYGEDEQVPPIPSPRAHDDGEIQMSPTQTDGPAALTPAEIRAKIGATDAGRPSLDEGLLKMPAMTLMRTSEASNDLVLTPVTPVNYPVLQINTAVPVPAPIQSPSATFSGMAPLHETARATMMSPDAMLKAYAASKRSSRNTPSRSNTYKAEATTSANGGMRTLYAPPTTASTTQSHEESAYEEESYSHEYSSYYGGTTGHGHTDSLGTEEGVVTYGHRAQAYPSSVEEESNNPFRVSAKVVSGAFSDSSRYSGMVEGAGHAQ